MSAVLGTILVVLLAVLVAVQGTRARMRTDFPKARYSQRALVESVISAVKHKLSARAPGRLLVMRCRQALLLELAYNIYLL